MWNYTEKTLDHFKNPRNAGEIKDADAVGEVGNIVCGDALRLFLRIDKASQRITDAKFKTFGCGSAIASSSALTEMIKGKTLDEASKITNQDIAAWLGGLPDEKMHCSVMGMEALEAAIKNFRGEPPGEHKKTEGKIVCKCFGVTELKILRTIRDNRLATVEQVTNFTKAGGGCGKCRPEIEKLIAEFWAKDKSKHAAGAAQAKKLTTIQKIHAIEDILAKEIIPMLKADGGFIELIDLEGDIVKVKLMGMCSGCPSSGLTLKSLVEKRLRELVDDSLRVEEVTE
ncbi:MAG: Fe-S cluster assembly protein NifU [bacterium]